ncbi:hypothetical protein C9374_006503 [Naegleria lovaniensis]|uniref:SGNH hydrolase-type esterase domain-containing protein n=1 Tax=Naegleria lovaniensis TaxID=51637 RepID=A0AA88KH87_NAELO|nr:uncharacterized protein C9374_006503 [Naegleria lovaniensis]KAG2381514.1 hypothetical protein C9374_006503 [Naegleria lovaniensis]
MSSSQSSQQSSSQQIFKKRPILYLLGDSITEQSTRLNGLHSLLLDWYSVKVDIINRGCSGYNSDMILEALKNNFNEAFYECTCRRVQTNHHHNSNKELIANVPSNSSSLPTVSVFICLGANDASSEHVSGGVKQHVPLVRYSENLQAIIQLLKTNLAYARLDILLCTPPPVHTLQYANYLKEKHNDDGIIEVRSEALVRPYAQAVRDLVEQYHTKKTLEDDCSNFAIHLVDLWKGSSNVEAWKQQSAFTDGLHLSSDGYRIVFKCLKSVISKQVPHFNADAMSFSHIYWRTYLELVQQNGSEQHQQ